MSRVRKIIELFHSSTGKKTIARRLNLPLNTVRRYIWLFLACGKSYDELMAMNDTELERMFIQMGNRKQVTKEERYLNLIEYFPKVEKEVKKIGVTRFMMWEKYKKQYPDGYCRSQFNHYYVIWHRSKYPSAVITHKAGAKMYVDYTGKKLYIVDPEKNDAIELEVFVAILGASQLIYCEASYSQNTRDFITSNVNALNYFGGSPEAIVTDNLKAAVIKSSKYEPTINEAFSDFASHYTMAVLPAAPYRPTYKSLVEGAVRIIYREIFAPLYNGIVFTSLESINAEIRVLLDNLNNRNFSNKKYSRRSLFNEIEAGELLELPDKPYVMRDRYQGTVLKNNHVRLAQDYHYYSVPYQFIGKKVIVYYDSERVEIYYKYERIAIHKRDRTAHAFTTQEEHLLAKNRGVNNWDIDKYLKRGEEVGKETLDYMRKIIEISSHKEAAFKACMGIINLRKGFSDERINNACKRAETFKDYSYRTIENILKKQLDGIKEDEEDINGKTLPKHDNIRGKDYYEDSDKKNDTNKNKDQNEN